MFITKSRKPGSKDKFKYVQCGLEKHIKQGLHYHLEKVNLYSMLVKLKMEVR